MKATNTLPTTWHRRPNKTGPCDICGCWYLSGQHRAVAPEENRACRWIVQQRNGAGAIHYKRLNDPPVRRRPGPKPGTIVRPHVPSKRITDQMTRAVYLIVAGGKTASEAADTMNVPYDHLRDWRERWAEIWKKLVDKTTESLIITVRATAGTDAVLDDPQEHIRRARACQRWTKAAGVELFPVGDDPTISTFYRDYYLPVRLSDNPEPTKVQYQGTVDLWVAITGDPPLKDISCELLARFKTCLQKMKGLKRGARMSPNTVRKHLKHLQILLDKAGPPGYRNRDAAGIISTIPPWVKPPRAEEKLPRIVNQELLGQVYLATVAMEEPRFSGVKAPAWWKALLVIAFNTQLRRRTLFEMRMDEIDWNHCQLDLPPERFKSHRRQIVHLNEVAFKHLRNIRTDRELVFPWPRSREYFYVCFHRLQKAAGIPRKDHFGLHDLRKTAASILWEDSPQAAQYALGHSSMGTTLKHYVNGTSIVARALDALPQPTAFTATAH